LDKVSSIHDHALTIDVRPWVTFELEEPNPASRLYNRAGFVRCSGITLVPHLPLTKFCKKSQKNLASVEISRNLTNAN